MFQNGCSAGTLGTPDQMRRLTEVPPTRLLLCDDRLGVEPLPMRLGRGLCLTGGGGRGGGKVMPGNSLPV